MSLEERILQYGISDVVSNRKTGETIVILDNGVIGRALCNFSCDDFDKDKGIAIAYARAVKATSEALLADLTR